VCICLYATGLMLTNCNTPWCALRPRSCVAWDRLRGTGVPSRGVVRDEPGGRGRAHRLPVRAHRNCRDVVASPSRLRLKLRSGPKLQAALARISIAARTLGRRETSRAQDAICISARCLPSASWPRHLSLAADPPRRESECDGSVYGGQWRMAGEWRRESGAAETNEIPARYPRDTREIPARYPRDTREK